MQGDDSPGPPRSRRLLLVGAVLAVTLIAGGVVFVWQVAGSDVDVVQSSRGTTTSAPDPETTGTTGAATTTVEDPCAGLDDLTWVAVARDEAEVPEVQVYDAPDGGVVGTVQNPWRVSDDGSGTASAPVFVVIGQDDPRGGDWLHVDLPTAPTGSLGYIRTADVSLKCLAYRITVNRQDFTLTLTYNGEPLFGPFPVGLGRDPRANQPGNYFITELVVETDENGVPVANSPYGTGAYGINGYSDNPEIVAAFPDTGGQIGIHGTNRPDLIPGNVSNGCIRLRNEDLEQLKTVVPLGTPVEVV